MNMQAYVFVVRFECNVTVCVESIFCWLFHSLPAAGRLLT